jgi:hypothetical protein
MDSIGRKRFASMGSDSTGNTKLGRELAQLEVLTILIVPDPNHHLSLTIKDICKLEYFQDVSLSLTHVLLLSSFSPLEKRGPQSRSFLIRLIPPLISMPCVLFLKSTRVSRRLAKHGSEPFTGLVTVSYAAYRRLTTSSTTA